MILRLIATSLLLALGEPSFSADSSPHKSGSVEANGIQLHYLDWGGKGKPIVFLTGFGLDAHEFDDLAPRLTNEHRVLAVTRRGFGMSDKPSKGYDLQTRANDIAEFLSAMKIGAANVIGHSMAGDEIVKIAVDHPDRVAKLVFLDAAAIDRTNMVSTMLGDPLLPPVWKKMASEVLGNKEEIDVPAGQLPPPDLYGRWIEILKTSSVGLDQVRKVKAPALVYFAIPDQHPAISPNLPEDQKKAADRYFATKMKPMMQHQIELVRSALRNAEFITIEPGDHYFFQQRGRETAEEILKFLRD